MTDFFVQAAETENSYKSLLKACRKAEALLADIISFYQSEELKTRLKRINDVKPLILWVFLMSVLDKILQYFFSFLIGPLPWDQGLLWRTVETKEEALERKQKGERTIEDIVATDKWMLNILSGHCDAAVATFEEMDDIIKGLNDEKPQHHDMIPYARSLQLKLVEITEAMLADMRRCGQAISLSTFWKIDELVKRKDGTENGGTPALSG